MRVQSSSDRPPRYREGKEMAEQEARKFPEASGLGQSGCSLAGGEINNADAADSNSYR